MMNSSRVMIQKFIENLLLGYCTYGICSKRKKMVMVIHMRVILIDSKDCK